MILERVEAELIELEQKHKTINSNPVHTLRDQVGVLNGRDMQYLDDSTQLRARNLELMRSLRESLEEYSKLKKNLDADNCAPKKFL